MARGMAGTGRTSCRRTLLRQRCLPVPPEPGGPRCQAAEYPASGFGQYCLNCHASAADGQQTFATTRFVNVLTNALAMERAAPLSTFALNDNIHYRLARFWVN